MSKDARVARFDPTSVNGKSVKDLIDEHAVSRPNDVFLIDPLTSVQITYGDLHEQCRHVASGLFSQGYRQGDSIAFAMPNGPDVVRVILGGLYGGFVITAVNLVSGISTIAYVLDHSDARAVFVNAKTRELVAQAIQQSPSSPAIVDFDEDWVPKSREPRPAEKYPPVEARLDSLLMYTSGTTGVPKGVVHTHRSLLAGACNTAVAHQLSREDRALCVLPLYHINGLCVTLLGTLVSGGSLVLPDRFSVTAFWSQLRDQRCSWFSVVPTQISYLLHEAETNGHSREGLEQVRFGRSASAPLAPEVQRSFETYFQIPVIETMGLTETAAQILSNPIHGPRKIGSPGIPFGNEVIIADDNQNRCSLGHEGEVLVRGANIMREYRKNPIATQTSLTKDGWLRTGDLGRMDEDGYVFITGRLKELIIKGGENIAPREIDDALYTHPDVIEAAAFARECKQYGQRVEAGVMIKTGSVLTPQSLIDLCIKQVGSFKAPDQVHVLPELPKGPSGKIQRMKLAELTKQIV